MYVRILPRCCCCSWCCCPMLAYLCGHGAACKVLARAGRHVAHVPVPPPRQHPACQACCPTDLPQLHTWLNARLGCGLECGFSKHADRTPYPTLPALQVLAALESLQRSIDRDEPEESVVALPEGTAAQPGSGTTAAAAAGGQPAAAQQPMQVG